VHSISKPVCFTFDDGYKDVLQEVYPILKRHQIPFTVYLTTRFIDGTIPPWRHHVEELVSAVSNVDLELGTSSYRIKCGSATEKLSAFNKVIQVAEQLPRSDFLYFLSSLRSAQRRAGLESNVSYLTWDDVAILSNDPLVTIGAHTVNHPRLSSLPEAECFAEMIDSKNLIEQKIGRPVRHFCYPYGNETDVGVREFRLAEDAGFLTATTSTQAALSPGLFLRGSRYLTRLPRIPGTSLWVNENAELIDYWFNGSASSLAAVYVYAKKLLS